MSVINLFVKTTKHSFHFKESGLIAYEFNLVRTKILPSVILHLIRLLYSVSVVFLNSLLVLDLSKNFSLYFSLLISLFYCIYLCYFFQFNSKIEIKLP